MGESHGESGNLSIHIARIEERFEERYKSTQAALTQANNELERRMAELNDVRSRFLPREVYDREVGNFRDRVATLEKDKLAVADYQREYEAIRTRVEVLERSRSSSVGTAAAYGTVVTFLLAVASILVSLFHK